MSSVVPLAAVVTPVQLHAAALLRSARGVLMPPSVENFHNRPASAVGLVMPALTVFVPCAAPATYSTLFASPYAIALPRSCPGPSTVFTHCLAPVSLLNPATNIAWPPAAQRV